MPDPAKEAPMHPPKTSLAILDHGNCEPLKASFHALALVLAGVMGVYNTAAWLRRRQPHLAVNAVIYIAAVFWERRHVEHHLIPCLPSVAASVTESNALSMDDEQPRADAA
jgi:hypothetical protein